MNREANNLYVFGEFRLDPAEQVLRRGTQPVPLAPRVFETLRILVERHGHVVSKTELIDAVWADTFVEESNLTQNIYTLRRILRTDDNESNLIETVPRRGYRFAAVVTIVERTDGGPEPFRDAYAVPDRESDPYEIEPRNEAKIPASRPSSLPMLGLGIAVLLLGTIALAGVAFFYPGDAGRSATPIEKVNFQKLTFTGDLTFPALAPNGNSFASVRGEQIVVQDIPSGEEMRITVEGHKVFGSLQFSVDGNTIYFRNKTGFDMPADIFQVSRFGGSPTPVAQNVSSGFGFSPDGKRLVFVRASPADGEQALIVRNLETGAENRLAAVHAPSTFLDNGYPDWSPDGKKIAVVVFRNAPRAPVSGLVVVDAESGDMEEIEQPQLRQFEQAVWLADGKSLIVSARENGKFFQLWHLEYPEGRLQKVTNDLNIYRGVSLSADKTKLLARQFTVYSHLWTGETNDLNNLRQRTFGNLNRDGMGGVTWTPAGDIIYVSRIMGDYDLWRYRPAEDSREQLTKNVGEINRYPSASPDGKHIFFDSNRTGTHHVWRMNSTGGSDQTQITFSEKDSETYPQASSDGKWIYYIQRSGKTTSVWRKSLVDGRAEALTEPGTSSPNNFLSMSPDGKLLAFHNAGVRTAEDEGQKLYQIGVIPTDARSEPRFFNIAASRLVVRWSENNSALDYIVNSQGAGQIWRQPIAGDKPPFVVIDLPNTFLHNFAWSMSGDKLVLSRGQQSNDAILLTNFQP